MENKIIRRSVYFYLLFFLTPALLAENLGDMLSGYVPGLGGTDQAWSVWVGGSFETGGSVAELEGRAFVRGDFIAGKPNYVIGRAGGGSGVYPDPTLPTLVVGGNILGSGGINLPGNLPIQVGSNIASTVSFIDRGAVITDGVDYAVADALRNKLSAKSHYWGSLPNTAGGSIKTQWGGVYLTADGANGNPKTWVFNLTFDLPSSFWGVDLSGFEPGDSILINCNKPGADDSFLMGVNSYNINGKNWKSPYGPKLLWNFPDAAQITFSGHAALQGSVLVGNPNSMTTVSIPGHDGRFVSCGSVIHTGHLGCEFHNYPFTGDLPELPAFSISGTVRVDVNQTSTQTTPDVPLPEATVVLYTDPDGDGDPSDGVQVATVKTDVNGAYAFSGLAPGEYVVVSMKMNGETSTATAVRLDGEDREQVDFLEEIDPAGFFYDTLDGKLVTGASISVSELGAVVRLDGKYGEYSFVSTNPAPTTYTIIVTPPAGYKLDPARPPQLGAFDPTGLTAPVVLGSGLSSGANALADWSAAANPYYLSFTLEAGDPLIINNNFPLVKSVATDNDVDDDPLSTRIDLKIYVDNDGAVKIQIATVNENGSNDIEIYAMIDDVWTLVATVPSEQIEGIGSNSYTVEALGLTPGASYMFKIVDESGHIFYTDTAIEVALVQLRALSTSLDPEYFTMKFNTEPYANYVLKVSTSLAADAEWEKEEFVQMVHLLLPNGVSSFNQRIQGAPEGITTLRVPRNRDKAFFKLVKVE